MSPDYPRVAASELPPGRIIALHAVTVAGIGPLGSLAAGALAGLTGARLAVVRGGALCLTAAVLFRVSVWPFLSEA